MRVTFILPFDGRNPVGGFKVVYEYANHLVQRGHHVTVVHPAGLYLGVHKNDWAVRNLLKYIWFALTHKYLPGKWFKLDPRVRFLWVPALKYWFVPKADVVVATAWETAEWVATYPEDRGRKYYLLQHLEDWAGDQERVLKTWKLPLKKIVIAQWLLKLASQMGEEALHIPNGLDFETFGLDVPPESRQPSKVLMLYQENKWKGSEDGLAALERVKKSNPELEVTLFGVKRPLTVPLPAWVTFVENPSRLVLRNLYNQAADFVAPSWGEGWGLTACEAMQCGCAVAMTAVNGHTEFGIDGVNALMSCEKSPEALALNIERLILDSKLRLRLSRQATETVRQFTWDRATDAIEAFFQDDRR